MLQNVNWERFAQRVLLLGNVYVQIQYLIKLRPE